MSEPIYSLLDQSELKEPQYVIAKRDSRNGRDYKRAFAVVPVWEDQPKEQSHADATTVLYALNELEVLRDSHAALVAALTEFVEQASSYCESTGYKAEGIAVMNDCGGICQAIPAGKLALDKARALIRK